MRNITLKFIGANYFNEACILIYNNNSLVYEGTTCNGKLVVCLKSNEIYQIKAKTKYGIINTSFYLNSALNTYSFTFPYTYICQCNKSKVLATFKLTDAYYDALPIREGEIYLWQR